MSNIAGGMPDHLSNLAEDVGTGLDAGAVARAETTEPLSFLGEQLVKLSGAAMALSALLSWAKFGPDAFPNIAGVGFTTVGAGFVVFVAGLYLLLQPLNSGIALGCSFGSFTSILIYVFVVNFELDKSQSGGLETVGLGAWVALASTSVACLGAIVIFTQKRQGQRHVIDIGTAATGIILALVGSLLLAWSYDVGAYLGHANVKVTSGLDSDIVTGIPVLIFGIIAFLALLLLVTGVVGRWVGERKTLEIVKMCGVAIMLLAGFHVVGGIMVSSLIFFTGWLLWSGPLAAFVGGVLLTNAVRPADSRRA